MNEMNVTLPIGNLNTAILLGDCFAARRYNCVEREEREGGEGKRKRGKGRKEERRGKGGPGRKGEENLNYTFYTLENNYIGYFPISSVP